MVPSDEGEGILEPCMKRKGKRKVRDDALSFMALMAWRLYYYLVSSPSLVLRWMCL